MRRIALAILFLVIVSGVSANARECKHEISASVGLATFQLITEGVKEAGLIIGTLGLIREDLKSVTPAIILHYKYFLKEELSIGLTFNYEKHEIDHYLLDDYRFTSDVQFYTFMPRADYTYFRSDLVQLYSGCALGFSIIRESAEGVDTEQEIWFAFHVNAFGVRVGKRFAGFLELGFGYNGIVAGGITAAF